MSYPVRMVRLILGLFLCSFGIFLSIRANVGLAPWDAFTIGFANLTGSTYGVVNIVTGLILITFGFLMGERFGLGTILNVMLIGIFIDLFSFAELVPYIENFPAGVAVLLLGQVFIAVGCYFYIGAGMGCGPRDSLMVVAAKKCPRLPIGLVRGVIEGTVLVIGWLLGAKVGIGTVIAMFGISYILQITFGLFKFDVKKVNQETLFYTLKEMFKSNQ